MTNEHPQHDEDHTHVPRDSDDHIGRPRTNLRKDKKINFTITKFQAIIGSIVALLTVIIPGIISYQTNVNSRFIENRRIELPAEQLRDSIKAAQKERNYKLETELALANYIEVYKLMYKLKNTLKNTNHVTIWKIHDHGGILNTAQQQYVTVLYSVSSDSFPFDIKGDHQSRDLSLGTAWFANKLRMDHFYLMKDIGKEPDFYIGESKAYFSFINDQSIAGMYIKSESNAMYYLTVGFPMKDPQDLMPYLDIKIMNTKGRLIRLIQDASAKISK